MKIFKKSRKKISLREYLTKSFIIVSVLPILITGIFVLEYFKKTTTQTLEQKNELLATAVAGEIRGEFVKFQEWMYQLEGFIEGHEHAPEEIDVTFDAVVDQWDYFDSLYLLNKNGIVSHVGLPLQMRNRRADFIGLDYKHHNDYKKIILTKKFVWSDVFLSVISGKSALSIMLPFRDQVLAGIFNIEHLHDRIDEIQSGRNLVTYLVDRYGVLIFHPEKNKSEQKISLRNVMPVAAGLNNKTGTFEYEYENVKYLGSVELIPETGWVLVVSQNLESVYAQYYNIRNTLIFSICAVITIMIFVAAVISSHLANPITYLCDITKKIASGNYKMNLPEQKYAETQLFADDFGSMMDAIGQREKTLIENREWFRFLVENQNDFVVRINSDKKVVYISPNYCQTFGMTEEEIIGQDFTLLVDPDNVETAIELFELIKTEKEINDFEDQMQSPVGMKWVSWNAKALYEQSGQMHSIVVAGRDITEKKQTEVASQQIFRLTSPLTGYNFFVELVKNISSVLGVKYAMVAKRLDDNPNYVGTMAVWADGKLAANFENNFIGTPCEMVMEKSAFSCSGNIPEQFPESPILSEMGVKSYIGVKLCDSYGRGIGILAALCDKPLHNIDFCENILKMFAVRASAELVRIKTEKQIYAYQRKLKSLVEQLTKSKDIERKEIALKIHDDIIQKLSFARMKLGQVTDTPFAQSQLMSVVEYIQQAIQQLRTLTFDLYSPILYDIGLEAALRDWLRREIAGHHDLSVSVVSENEPVEIDDEIKSILFRSAKELVTNAIKHSSADNVDITIEDVGSEVIVEVSDNGVGFSVDINGKQLEGLGLFSVRERLENLGGTLEIESEKGYGSTVRMKVEKCVEKEILKEE